MKPSYHIVLLGNPLSNNSIYKRGKGRTIYMTKEGKALKEDYVWQAKEQWKKPLIEGKLKVLIGLYFGDRRKHDWDNYGKLLDALNGVIWWDDSQIREANVKLFYDKQNPRIEVKIFKM